MKNTAHPPATRVAAVRQHSGQSLPGRSRRGRAEGVKAAQTRAEQKHGAYKRVEIFLGLEAALALRRLMRDGRSAREVIESLLLDERKRRQGQDSPPTGRLP